MNYRAQAFLLGTLLMIAGGSILLYAAVQAQALYAGVQTAVQAIQAAQNQTIIVQGQTIVSLLQGSVIPSISVIAFIGLGLILIGSIATFAAPQTLITSEVVGQVSAPAAKNLSMVLDSLSTKSSITHVPRVILGGESQVLLVVSTDGEESSANLEGSLANLELQWNRSRKVLEPTGIDLMKGYEQSLKRDFFGLELPQLGHFLTKAIVHELQLSSGFSLKELSPDSSEATWTKSTVLHACTASNGARHPELCQLCSSVACALAKASGRPVRIEGSTSNESSLQVVTTYRIVGD